MIEAKQFNRLPLYAQDEFFALQREVKYLKERVSLLMGDVPSLVNAEEWDGSYRDRIHRPLGDDVRVSFEFPEGKFYVNRDVHWGGTPRLYVSSDLGTVQIRPRASNAFHVSLERY